MAMKLLLIFSVFALGAAEHEELSKAMKIAGSTVGPLKKSLDGGMMADAGAAARTLQGVFETAEKFWTEQKVADATKWSQEAQGHARTISTAVTANDADAAKAAFGKLAATCKSCHDVHRERLPDGTFKIK
jgi:cytochrome c556